MENSFGFLQVFLEVHVFLHDSDNKENHRNVSKSNEGEGNTTQNTDVMTILLYQCVFMLKIIRKNMKLLQILSQ